MSGMWLAGHGHVRPRADGVKARCGGPAICSVCAQEQAALLAAQQQSTSLQPDEQAQPTADEMLDWMIRWRGEVHARRLRYVVEYITQTGLVYGPAADTERDAIRAAMKGRP